VESGFLDSRERLAAQEEKKTVRRLSNYDYLVGIEDLTRMGGIRYHTEKNGAFINSNS
jgi:serine/threonine-protein kinase HipA